MDIKSAIQKGKKILKDKLILTAELDSEILLAKAINKSREYVVLNSTKIINNVDYLNYNKLIKKRSFRKPISIFLKIDQVF